MNAKKATLRIALLTSVIGLTACATNYNPPCRRVSAAEFMRPHIFNGVASDRFVGSTDTELLGDKGRGKAYKEIRESGLFHGWAVIWTHSGTLPRDYIANARHQPNRP